jgi:hypothetical protein
MKYKMIEGARVKVFQVTGMWYESLARGGNCTLDGLPVPLSFCQIAIRFGFGEGERTVFRW